MKVITSEKLADGIAKNVIIINYYNVLHLLFILSFCGNEKRFGGGNHEKGDLVGETTRKEVWWGQPRERRFGGGNHGGIAPTGKTIALSNVKANHRLYSR
jgi:hypothetical protein